MASENVTKFREVLQSEPELQAKLEDLGEAFDGDHSNERAFLEATVCKVAEDAGLPFSAEDAQELFGEGE